MQATEADRERVLRELRERFATDALTQEEFDRRVTEVLDARSRSDLAALVPGGEITAAPVPKRVASPSARTALEEQLAPGEWLDWVGSPDPSKHFNRGDVFIVPFSIMWCAFALFWEGTVIATGPPFFILWGIPFVAVGLYMVVGRFFYKASRRRRTVYAVTNRRVMVLVRRRNGTDVEARSLQGLSSVSTRADPRGFGTIEFDNSSGAPSWMADSGLAFFGAARARVGLCFADIEEAPAVAALVERLRAVAS